MMANVGGLARILQVALPKGGWVLAMIEGYFDESGSFDQAPGIFCISGYFMTSEAAQAMDKEWGRVLDEHAIPYFHMVDCAHGNGPFANTHVDERANIVRELIALIKKYTGEGISVIFNKESFEAIDATTDVYSFCVEMVVMNVKLLLDYVRRTDDCALFFESGHVSGSRAYKHIAERLKEFSASLTFADKRQVKLLQAADLLAWQSAKYAKDQISGKRPPRKDFLSLMEHKHDLYRLFVEKGQKVMAIEQWPLSRRAPTTENLTLDTDAPLVYFYDGTNKMPIIKVTETGTLTRGADGLTYVHFKDMKQTRFALAFDGMHLYEAIVTFLHALDALPKGRVIPYLNADVVEVEQRGDQLFLGIGMEGVKTRLMVLVPKKALKQLRKVLKKWNFDA
jgi:hypothetical protein